MKSEARFPLQEYGDRSILTTWTMSYRQVQRPSEEAAWMLKLWGLLDSGELWYELIAAGVDVAGEMDVPAWLLTIAEDELEFGEAIRLLARYSLVDSKEGTEGHSMHSVLHRWCGHLADEEEQDELGCLAVGLVASNVPLKSDAEFWKKRKRVMAHGLRVNRWIVGAGREGREGDVKASIRPGSLHSLGYLLEEEDRQRAAQMYQRALAGKEKAWGPQHTSTLTTVNNLGNLYKVLGRLEEAEQMYQRALAGYAKAIHPDNLLTCVPALNNMWAFASLRQSQGRIEDARHWYSHALLGYEKTFGERSDKCQALRDNLAALASEEREEEGEGEGELDVSTNIASVQRHT